MREPLPIDAVLPDLLAAARSEGAVVLEAPPGSGKTTRVPPALAAAFPGEIVVLEPRRIAARASAARVAAEHGSRLGDHVGYAVRHDRRAGPDTRVLFVTEALLTRRLAADPTLTRGPAGPVGAVVLDEFHERSVHTDVALALLADLRRARPDLVLVVMSATFDGRAVAAWLGCPHLVAGGRPYPVEIDHLARPDDRPLPALAAAAVRAELSRLGDADRGAILVFLPGAGEIARTAEALTGLGVPVLPLHGELDAAAQDRALQPTPGRPRVVLATNVAETSLTVPDVAVVIDSGLARVAGHDPWSGLGTLTLTPISRASADQRAGRAGRTGPGRCLRLYTRRDDEARPASTPPELHRVDLAGVLLDLATRARRPGEPLEPAWFEPPPAAGWAAAHTQLRRLGALAPAAAPADTHADSPADSPSPATDLGHAMARFPLSPRLARVLVEAAGLGFPAEGAALVARLDAVRARGTTVEDPVAATLHERLPAAAEPVRAQLLRLLGRAAAAVPPGPASPSSPTADQALARALLAGFPDRVGKRRAAPGNAYGAVVFAEGGSAALDAPYPQARDDAGFVVVSGVERIGDTPKVRALTPIPPDWLVDEATVRTVTAWTGTRVDVREQLVYGALVLDESPGTGDPAAVATLLAEHALPVAHKVFPDADRAAALVNRVRWLRATGALPPEADGGPPDFDLPALVLAACRDAAAQGVTSLADLGHVSLVATAPLGSHAATVARLAPEAIPLGNRARVPITWPDDGDPYLASRMQDFFGMAASPTVGAGQPLVLHLLAPSRRPVQVTTDLAGFWTRHYPAIRRELARKYVRHYWPEDPLQAEPIQHVRDGVPLKR